MVVVAVWNTTPELASEVASILCELARASVGEAGCSLFDVFASTERPGRFVLFETYANDEARLSHRASEHFHRLVLDRALSLGVDRQVDICEPVGR